MGPIFVIRVLGVSNSDGVIRGGGVEAGLALALEALKGVPLRGWSTTRPRAEMAGNGTWSVQGNVA